MVDAQRDLHHVAHDDVAFLVHDRGRDGGGNRQDAGCQLI